MAGRQAEPGLRGSYVLPQSAAGNHVLEKPLEQLGGGNLEGPFVIHQTVVW